MDQWYHIGNRIKKDRRVCWVVDKVAACMEEDTVQLVCRELCAQMNRVWCDLHANGSELTVDSSIQLRSELFIYGVGVVFAIFNLKLKY